MNYSKQYRDYRLTHLVCEGCGRRTNALPHHILSRGAHGVIDTPSNLLELCPEHHALWHTIGRGAFLKQFPHLADKVMSARGK
jgi:hypothetical protein